MAKRLHLVIPGLLGPWPERDQPGFPSPEAAALERLLARATVEETGIVGADATLFGLFNLPLAADRDLPVAAITWLTDSGIAEEGWWLRADPVHLRADLHQVLLVDARTLSITPMEAASLVAEFNQVFAADGLLLKAPHPGRWYLRLASDPGLRTCPLLKAIGRDINPLLPQGEAGRRWHTLLTEIQMLFHNAAVNQEREAQGRLPINSVWFWGGGELPQGAHSSFQGVYADDPLARGLARLAGVVISPPPATATDWRLAAENEAETLVVLEATRYDPVDNDPIGWAEQVSVLERDWFMPSLEMLTGKALNSLSLYPCNGRVYTLTRSHWRRFWRRRRPLADYL